MTIGERVNAEKSNTTNNNNDGDGKIAATDWLVHSSSWNLNDKG